MDWWTEAQRLFHSLGPKTKKAWMPNFRFVRNMAKFPRLGDESPLELEAEHGATMNDVYDKEVPEWVWYLRMEILNAIRVQMGSQCSCFSVGTCRILITLKLQPGNVHRANNHSWLINDSITTDCLGSTFDNRFTYLVTSHESLQ